MYDSTYISLYGEYDIFSVMQYGCYSFPIDYSKPTITAKNDPYCYTELGQPFYGGYFRQSDINKLNEMYKC